jgi:hypothetical protein
MGAVRHIVTVDEDDEEFNDLVFDRAYCPRKVYKNGCGVSVGLHMSDAAPVRRLPEYRPPVRPDYGLTDAEASRHRPHQLMCDSAEVTDARRAAIAARDAYVRQTCDAWRHPIGDAKGDDDDGDGNGDDTDPKAAAKAARDAYIARTVNAWREPINAASPYVGRLREAVRGIEAGSPDASAQIEAAQRRMSLSQPNATAASVKAQRERNASTDAAALADKEAAYAEYVARTLNAHRSTS